MNSDQEVVGIFTGACFALYNPDVNITNSNYTTYRQGNCTFTPKETFKGTASLKYRAKNTAGFVSEERMVTFNVRDNYQDVLNVIGIRSSYDNWGEFVRYPEQHGPNTRYGSLYLYLGGSDNSIYAGPYNDKEMYPIPFYSKLVNDLRVNAAYNTNAYTTDILSNMVSINAKDGDICGIRGVDKNIVCWSKNFENLNSGYINQASIPPYYVASYEKYAPRLIVNQNASALLTNAQEVAPGETFSCAIIGANKEVVCWGKNVKGCGSTFTPGLPCNVKKDSDDTSLINAKKISVGKASACAIVTESSVDKLYCWGYKMDAGGAGEVTRSVDFANNANYDLKAKPININNPVKIAVGELNACISSTDNKLYCFGSNYYGILGRGITYNSKFYDPAPVRYNSADLQINPNLFDLAGTSYSQDFGCAIGQDNNLYCWGYNPHVKLFNQTAGEHASAKQMVLNESEQIVDYQNAANQMCIRLQDNKVKCWGDNNYGQLGSQTLGWLSYSEVSYLRERPNGNFVSVKDFALASDGSSYNNIYFITQNLIENHDAYQQENQIAEMPEGGSATANIISSIPEGDELIILKKPAYGSLSSGEDFTQVIYNSFVNIGDGGNSYFDFITYYLKSDPTKVYKYFFETKTTNNTPTLKNYEGFVFKNNPLYIYNSTLGADSDSTFGFELLSEPIYGTFQCYQYPGLPVTVKQYCYYTPNNNVINQEEVISYRMYDGNSYSPVSTFKFKLVENNKVYASSSLVELNILSYYPASLTSVTTNSLAGAASSVTILSGVENDGGIYKLKDSTDDRTIATIDPSCFLSGYVYGYTCNIKPISGITGSASVMVRYNAGAYQSDAVEYRINIGQNINNILYAVGYVSGQLSGAYQTNSYLFRLQGGTNPSLQSADSYPFPMVSRYSFATAIPQGGNPPENRTAMANISKIVQSPNGGESFCAVISGEAWCYGGLNEASNAGINSLQYGQAGYQKVYFNNGNPIQNVQDMTVGTTQGCAIYGVDKKLACWGRTRYDQISQNDILRSGCGQSDTYTRKGFACNIVKPDGSQLTNVEKVQSYGNTTCAVVKENNKGQLYCWGFRFDGNGVDTRTEGTASHNTNFAQKIPGFENDNVASLSIQQNKACVTLESGHLSCLGGTNYWGSRNRPDYSGKYLGRNLFILDATVTGTIQKKMIQDEHVIIEVPVPSSEHAGVSLSNWSVSNEDDSSPEISLNADRVSGATVYKSLKIKIKNKKDYEVSFSLNSNQFDGLVAMDAAVPDSLISNSYSYCVKTEANNFYCWGYDAGRYLSENATAHLSYNEATKIDWMSSIEPYKRLIQNYSSMCLINLNDEAKCWGTMAYGSSGRETDAFSGTVYIPYSASTKFLQKINGATAKVKDIISSSNTTLLLSENLMDMNIDPQPVELSLDENQVLAGLIPNIDTDLYEYFIISKPSSGTLSGSLTDLQYTPTANYNGRDQFTYRVYDKLRNYSVVNTVILKVKDINNSPKSDNKSYAFVKNTLSYVYFTGSDPEGNPLTYVVESQPQHAQSFTCTSSYCTYTPETDYVGLDSFTYKVFDGTSYSNISTVSIDIRNDNKPFFDNSLFSFVIPSNLKKYPLKMPTAIVPGYTSTPYLSLELTPRVVREFDKSISFKNESGEVIATVSNCFMYEEGVSTYSQNRDCIFNLKPNFPGTLSFRYKAINPTNPAAIATHHSDYVQIDLSVGLGGKTLYALGYVDSTIYTNPIGHFEINSLEYRYRGGTIGNSQISHLSSKEIYPVPLVYGNLAYNDVSFVEAGSSGICWMNNSGIKDVNCMAYSNGQNEYGIYTFGYYSSTGPVQQIYNADNTVLSDVKKMDIGSYQSCAIMSDDTVSCWGNTLPSSITPTTVDNSGCGFSSSVTTRGKTCKLVDNSNSEISNVIDISLGNLNQGCLVKNDNGIGKVYCWGSNFEGTTVVSPIAKEMTSLNTGSVVKISVGDNYLCAAYNDNSIKCMGSNSYGRLGINSTSGTYFPASSVSFFEEDGITPVTIKPHTLQTSLYMGCVQDSNDKLQCWGYSSDGLLTNSAQYPSMSSYAYKPKIILNNKDIAKFSLNNRGICITDSLSEVSCLGANEYGQLGNGRSLLEFNYTSDYNNYNYISPNEMRPIKEYLNKTNVKANNVAMTYYNTYLLVNPENLFDVPLIEIQETIQEGVENTPFNVTFSSGENVYYIFQKPTYGVLTGDSTTTLVYTVGEGIQTSFIDFFTYMVKDMFGNTTVKKYVFKVESQNDKPVYVNRNLITYSGATLNFSHQSTDPDSTSYTYTVTQSASSGSLNCAGASCSYIAPTLNSADPDTVEIIRVRSTDNQGNNSLVDGTVTITVKAISSPIFNSNLVSYTMYNKETYLSMSLPAARDPKNLTPFYTQSGNTVRNVFDSALNTQVAKVYDKNNANLEAGHISGTCALAYNGTASNIDDCYFNLKAGYSGTARFEYLASNGTDASSVVIVEIDVLPLTGLFNYGMITGILDISRSGILHVTTGQEANIDYFVPFYQKELNPNNSYKINPEILKNVEKIYYNPKRQSYCVKKRSEIDPDSSKIECSAFENYFGKRPIGTVPSGQHHLNYRFVSLNNEMSNETQTDIVDFSIGYTQACAIIAPYNEVKCWGDTYDYTVSESTIKNSGCGFLGVMTSLNLPCKIVDTNNEEVSNVIDIGIGQYNKCLVRDNNGVGQVMCWGYKNYGDQSNPVTPVSEPYNWTTEENFAKIVPGTESFNFRSVESGGNFTCAETTDNNLVCWGQNKSGQLGKNNYDSTYYTTYSFSPQEISLVDNSINVGVKPNSLTVQDSTACAIGATDHQIYCWGNSLYSNMYEDSSSYKMIPTKLAGFTQAYNFKKIKLAESGMCGILTNDEVICWGYNYYKNFSPLTTGDSYIRRNQVQKVIDPVTSQPMRVDDLAIPYYNTIFIKKNN